MIKTSFQIYVKCRIWLSTQCTKTKGKGYRRKIKRKRNRKDLKRDRYTYASIAYCIHSLISTLFNIFVFSYIFFLSSRLSKCLISHSLILVIIIMSQSFISSHSSLECLILWFISNLFGSLILFYFVMWNIEHYLFFVVLSIWLLYFCYFMPDQRSHWLICSSIKKKIKIVWIIDFSASWHDLYLYVYCIYTTESIVYILKSNVQCSVFGVRSSPVPNVPIPNVASPNRTERKFSNNKNRSV